MKPYCQWVLFKMAVASGVLGFSCGGNTGGIAFHPDVHRFGAAALLRNEII
jgi:hypothetical protein